MSPAALMMQAQALPAQMLAATRTIQSSAQVQKARMLTAALLLQALTQIQKIQMSPAALMMQAQVQARPAQMAVAQMIQASAKTLLQTLTRQRVHWTIVPLAGATPSNKRRLY